MLFNPAFTLHPQFLFHACLCKQEFYFTTRFSVKPLRKRRLLASGLNTNIQVDYFKSVHAENVSPVCYTIPNRHDRA